MDLWLDHNLWEIIDGSDDARTEIVLCAVLDRMSDAISGRPWLRVYSPDLVGLELQFEPGGAVRNWDVLQIKRRKRLGQRILLVSVGVPTPLSLQPVDGATMLQLVLRTIGLFAAISDALGIPRPALKGTIKPGSVDWSPFQRSNDARTASIETHVKDQAKRGRLVQLLPEHADQESLRAAETVAMALGCSREPTSIGGMFAWTTTLDA